MPPIWIHGQLEEDRLFDPASL